MPQPIRFSGKNRILAALPPQDLERFFSCLRPVSLAHRRVLYMPGAPLHHIYFVEEGLTSMVTMMENG